MRDLPLLPPHEIPHIEISITPSLYEKSHIERSKKRSQNRSEWRMEKSHMGKTRKAKERFDIEEKF